MSGKKAELAARVFAAAELSISVCLTTVQVCEGVVKYVGVRSFKCSNNFKNTK